MTSRPWNSRPVGPNKLTCFPLSGPFKVRKFSVGLSKHGALLLFCLAFSCPSPGQDIDPDLITAEELRSARNQNITLGVPWGKFLPAPETLASDLLEDYELVADGEFYGLPESSPEELRTLKRETVLVRFRIHKLYKGTEPEAIDIELDNDMLIVPGEGISRGGKNTREKKIDSMQFWPKGSAGKTWWTGQSSVLPMEKLSTTMKGPFVRTRSICLA